MKKILLLIPAITFLSFTCRAQIGSDPVSQDLQKVYTQLTNSFMYGGAMWMYGECRSENSEVGGEGPGDMPQWQNAMQFDASPDDYYLAGFFRRAYTQIHLCNKVIADAPASGLDAAVQERLTAEARFLRALTYFNLAILFNSVPLHTDPLYWPMNSSTGDFLEDNVVPGPLASMSETFNQVKSDLIAAAPDLPLRNMMSEGEEYRVSSGAAYALLAKTYLYESSYIANFPGDARFAGMTQHWQDALDAALVVINSGEYALEYGETYNTWWDGSYLYPGTTPGFRYIFTVDGSDHSGRIFSAWNQTPEGGYVSYGNNYITAFSSCRYVLSEEGNQQNAAWGLNVPTQTLVDAFAAETGNATDDPRFAVTVGQDGDSMLLPGTAGDAWLAMSFDGLSFVDRANRKFECSPEEFWNNNDMLNSPMPIPVIRYADLLLMAAEANVILGNTADALGLVNQVRQRANGSGSTGYPEDLTAVTLLDIMNERQLELALEGQRFFDLVRWGVAHNTLDGIYIETHDLTATFEQGVDEFLPFPNGVLGDPDIPDGTVEPAVEKLSIYPNPARDYLAVQGLTGNSSIQVMSIGGNHVMDTELTEGNNRVDISGLPEGIYFIKLTHSAGTQVWKVVKR